MNRPNPDQARLDELRREQRQGHEPSDGNDRPAAVVDPPRESGARLATCPRPGRAGQPPEELRVTLDAYEGHPFVGVRLWTLGNDRRWFPSKRGISIRVGELLTIIKALVRGARELGLGLDLHPKPPAPSAQDGGDRG